MNNNQEIELNFSLTTLQIRDLLKNFIIGGIFLILLLPIFGNFVGQELLFRSITEIIFVAFIFLVIIDKSFLPRLSPILIAVSAFWFISGLANIFSLQPSLSFWGDPYRGGGFFTLTHLFIFYLILISILKKWQEWKKFIYWVILVSFLVILISFAFRDTATPFARISGPLGNPTFLGAYLLLLFFVTALLAWQEKNKILKIFLCVIAISQLIALILTYSRGALSGLVVGIFVLCALLPLKRKKIILSALLIALVIVGGLGICALHNESLKTFLKTLPIWNRLIESLENPMDGRILNWRAGILGIKEKPLLGFGQENYNAAFNKYFRPIAGDLDAFGAWMDRAHNFILDIGVTTGILGLLAYLSIWVTTFWLLFKESSRSKRSKDFFRIGLIATFAAYLTQNLFIFDTVISQIYVFFWLGLISVVFSKEFNISFGTKLKSHLSLRFNSLNSCKTSISTKKIILLTLTGVILIPILFFSLKNYHLDSWQASVMHKTAPYIRLEDAFKRYDKYLQDWTYLSHTLRHEYASALLDFASKINDPQKTKEAAKKALVLIDENNEKERYYFNRSWILGGTISRFLIEKGENDYIDNANFYFSKAIEMSPNRAGTWLEWGKAYIAAGDFDKAEEKFTKARDLNPHLADPNFMLGLTALYKDDKETAGKEFALARQKFIENQHQGYNPAGENALLNLAIFYYKKNDLQNLCKTYEKLVKETHNQYKPEYWFSLAATHKELGEKQKARETIESMFKIYPNQKQNRTVQRFLESL